MQHQPLSILCAGECMLELKQATSAETELFAKNYSGDVINFAVYLKRVTPESHVQFLSAIGQDPISEQMHDFFIAEGIDTATVARTPAKTVGLYMIHTDATGERSFSYWREASAARQTFELSDPETLGQLAASVNYFYFSGITLAILGAKGAGQLLELAGKFRTAGGKVLFDPNYRPALWGNAKQGRESIEAAYRVSDTVLTSTEDQYAISTLDTPTAVLAYLQDFGVDEIVLTNGPDQIQGMSSGQPFDAQPTPTDPVIDTTAAGDAFNAGYLAARHAGAAPGDAATKAAQLASAVISQPGAIMPASMMPAIN